MQVCALCFNDLELVTFINENSKEKGFCKYCNKEDSMLINLEELIDFFVEFFEIFSESDAGIPLIEIINKDWNLFSGEKKGDQILQDILNVINIPIKSADLKVLYVEEILDCVSYWGALKEDLKWSRRFLTDTSNIFELGWDGFFNKQTQLDTQEILYRARIHKNEGEAAYTNNLMGCPEKLYASSGRANPHGIPYLYLSKNYQTTFYETRATYLDEVSIGKFKVKANEEVILVDFTLPVSAFLNVNNILEYTKSFLLKKYISLDLSKPLRRYDSELEYIPTQFICEFIRYITGSDGIIFNSSLHVGGKNIVLFNEKKMECFEVEKYQISKIEIVGNKI